MRLYYYTRKRQKIKYLEDNEMKELKCTTVGYSTTAVQQALTLMMNVRFILSQPKKEDKKMSLTAKEFDKAIKLHEEISKAKAYIRQLENHYAASFYLTWGNMHDFVNEKVAIPYKLEEEIVQRIYEWYKNRLKQAEDEFSELVTRE